MDNAAALTLAHLTLVLVLGSRVLLRPHRDPSSRIAWIVVILALPGLGLLAYLLFGEVYIGRDRIARMHKVTGELLPLAKGASADACDTSTSEYRHLFQVGHSISGLNPVGGNRGALLPDSNTVIDTMVADIDAAREHVHLLFYIWLPDNNGCKVIEALLRAASRGVKVRAMADAMGSRLLIKSPHWQAMRAGGVHLASALPPRNPLLRPLAGRVDLRNHRKIVVIDGQVTYCGSQNCADPEFRIKARYAPWVDSVMRFEGPVAGQAQYLFICDWMSQVDEDIRGLLEQKIPAFEDGFAAQVFGTGPTVRYSAMPEMFGAVMQAARRELVISTPYFVPSEPMLENLRATAYRGVDTTLILPARNDSMVVAAASRSYYATLLRAGVKICLYQDGLLHAKTLTIDGQLALIGSANMDRRSFELNYENNILLSDRALTAALRQRQQSYIEQSVEVTAADIAAWSMRQRLWHNAVATLGPVL
jgi:cardiolipin synthase